MFIYGGLKGCTGGTKHRINGTQAVKYSAEAISDLVAPIVSYMVVKHNFDKIMEWRLYCRAD